MPESKQHPSLTVFGATGGCSATVLAHALRAGLSCAAMARTPHKLIDILRSQHNISFNEIEAHLTISQGNIKSVDDIERVLSFSGRLPDRILFGVGGSPIFQLSLFRPLDLDDPHVCETGMRNVLSALRLCHNKGVPLGRLGSKPGVIAISTISMSNVRDMPYLYYPLEYWFLNVPRADKLLLEKVVYQAAGEEDPPMGVFAFVRPPLLTEGPELGLEKVRAGWVWPDHLRREMVARGQKEAGPQIGWSITKADIGRWVFENLVTDSEERFGKCWSLTS